MRLFTKLMTCLLELQFFIRNVRKRCQYYLIGIQKNRLLNITTITHQTKFLAQTNAWSFMWKLVVERSLSVEKVVSMKAIYYLIAVEIEYEGKKPFCQNWNASKGEKLQSCERDLQLLLRNGTKRCQAYLKCTKKIGLLNKVQKLYIKTKS